MHGVPSGAAHRSVALSWQDFDLGSPLSAHGSAGGGLGVGARVGGTGVGALVGRDVGVRLGDLVGRALGDLVGRTLGDLVGLVVGVAVVHMPWPHFRHVLGHAASALVRIPTSPRLQYRANRFSPLAIHEHFFRFLRATLPMIADVSRHLSAREGQGMPHVTGQMTADSGSR